MSELSKRTFAHPRVEALSRGIIVLMGKPGMDDLMGRIVVRSGLEFWDRHPLNETADMWLDRRHRELAWTERSLLAAGHFSDLPSTKLRLWTRRSAQLYERVAAERDIPTSRAEVATALLRYTEERVKLLSTLSVLRAAGISTFPRGRS
jgi:hypothetical protein